VSDKAVRTSKPNESPILVRGVCALGMVTSALVDSVASGIRYLGGLTYLLHDTISWTIRGLFTKSVRFGWHSLASQMVRIGVRSIPIIIVVQIFIGLILALQMAPTLKTYGKLDSIAEIVGIAVIRELGPLLTAVVLSGFAGASIAAEIGAMVESEEIKALRAHALNPIRFLVVPRVIATTVMLTALSVIADYVGILGGFFAGVLVLDVSPASYLNITQSALKTTDFATGLVKAAVFGMVISSIACYEGFAASGGPAGVGRATTGTVVKSIVALIGIDALFTAAFYAFGI